MMPLLRRLAGLPEPAPVHPDTRAPEQVSDDQVRAAFAVLAAACDPLAPQARAETLIRDIVGGSSTWQVAGAEGLVYGLQNAAMGLLVAYAEALGVEPEDALRELILRFETAGAMAGRAAADPAE